MNVSFAASRVTMNVPNNRYHDHWLLLIENFVPDHPHHHQESVRHHELCASVVDRPGRVRLAA